MVELYPFIDEKGHINGTFWLLCDDKKQTKNMIIRILKERDAHQFTINSDLAGSLYKYHYLNKDDKYPSALHV